MKKIAICWAFALLMAFQATAQFTSTTLLTPLTVSTDTKDKPQSKVWMHGGKFWTVMPTATGTFVFRLDGSSWTSVLKLSSSTYGRADCKTTGDVTHVLIFKGTLSDLFSIEYVATSNTYKLWTSRTAKASLSLDAGVETATIDIDGNGRMWLASDAETTVNVRWSDSPYSTWSEPITLASDISTDDMCAVKTFPGGGKIGVFWSNQTTKRFGFKTHDSGASPATWSADEVPASQSALNSGYGMADDHMNLAFASNGTLYCAAKTSYDKTNYPKLILLVRRPNGTWDNLYEVTRYDVGTRPIVILNESTGKLKVIYSSIENGGNIIYQESSMNTIAFSGPYTLINGTYNYVTCMKDNYNSEVVLLVSDSTSAQGILATDQSVSNPSPPGTPVLSSPANGAMGVPVSPTLTWSAVTNATTYQVQVSTTSDFLTLVSDQTGLTATQTTITGLTENTTYYWRARASNAGGTSNWSSEWSFTTLLPPPPTPALVGYWKMDEGSGTTLLDASGYLNNGSISKKMVWETGISGLALKFNGTSQYATVPNNSSLNSPNELTLAAWVKPAKLTTQYVIAKGVNGQTNGYELTLAADNRVFFRFNQFTSGDTYKLISTANYPTDGTTWMHIAATYNGSVMKIYINGIENASKVVNTPVQIQGNSLNLGIGAQSDGMKRFKGSMDEVRIYNYALSANDISTLAGSSGSRIAGAKQEATLTEEFRVYPNPFSTTATIHFSFTESTEYCLELYTMDGTPVKHLAKGTAKAGEMYMADVDGSDLTRGLYIIQLQTTTGIKILKLRLDK